MEVPCKMGPRQYLRLLILGGGLAILSVVGCGDSGTAVVHEMTPGGKKALDESRLGPSPKKYEKTKPGDNLPGKSVR
jgi:hypothetical protein